jgi:hypothetical protein
MSMYSQLLAAGLDESEQSNELTSVEAFAEMCRCRTRIHASRSFQNEMCWVPGTVADQLVYDIALVRYARTLGINCEVRDFDRPEGERQRIEWALVSRGIC